MLDNKSDDGIRLYEVRKDVKCLKCGCKGAVISYGHWYPNGMGDRALKLPSVYHKYKDQPKMSQMMGPGGTIPHECLNCGNVGLINMSMECINKGFETIKEEE
jgi:hypothetical protein